jgi:hypothetical protein
MQVTIIGDLPAEQAKGCNSPEHYRLLGERFNSGDPESAAGHDGRRP